MTVYKKIDSIKDFGKYIKFKEGKKYITESGIEILRKSIKKLQNDINIDVVVAEDIKDIQDNIQEKFKDDTKEDVKVVEDRQYSQYTDLQKEFTENLKQQILDLKGELLEKNDNIKSLTRLLENSQVLQKQQQDKIFLLESPQDNKKSMWSIFKRN